MQMKDHEASVRSALTRLAALPASSVIRHVLRWIAVAPLAVFWSLRLGRVSLSCIHPGARLQGWRTVKIGHLTEIDRGTILSGLITIGRFCQINQNAVLRGQICVGNHVMIANNVTIVAGGHDHLDLTMPMRFQGGTSSPISIEDDVWIGASATILGGITICRGTIVGAGAVVTKSFPAYSVLGGVPARLLRSRIAQLPLT